MQVTLSDKAKKLLEWAASQKLYQKCSVTFDEILNTRDLEIADEDELLDLIKELQNHPEMKPFDRVYDGKGFSVESECSVNISAMAALSWQEYQRCEQQAMCPDCKKPVLIKKIVRRCPECGHEHDEQ